MYGRGMQSRSTASLCAALLVATVAIGGCGGDDGDSTASDRPRFSAATEPTHVFIRRMVNLLETTTVKKDCAQLEQINKRSYVRFPCPPAKELRDSMADFELVGAKEYGTGGVVDYRSGAAKDGAAIVLFVAPDRNWGISKFGLVTEPSTKSDDEDSREGFEAAVEDYLTAVRDRDCQAFQEATFIDPRLKKSEICTKALAGTKKLAERLNEHPRVEPRYEGGNASYGFFTFETTKPDENLTISVLKAGAGDDASYQVLDVAPSPTSLEQETVRRQLEKEQKKKGSGRPNTSP
jgi:hypothetical protein